MKNTKTMTIDKEYISKIMIKDYFDLFKLL